MKNELRTDQASQHPGTERLLANGLGWFSIGLGLAEVLAPGRVAKLTGMDHQHGLIRAMGVRELGSGAGLLSCRATDRWAWSRLGGDLLDLAMLGAAAKTAHRSRSRLAISAAAVAGVAALDFYCSRRLARTHAYRDQGTAFKSFITIDRPPEDLYRAWRNFEDLPRFMAHLVKVEQTGENRWRWTAKGPAGTKVSWEAEIVEDLPYERISWRSLEHAQVRNSGTVSFALAPGGRGSVVSVNLEYEPPAGKLGAWIAGMFGQSPEKQVPVDLHRFKQWMETGEIATTEGQPAGRSSSTSKLDIALQH